MRYILSYMLTGMILLCISGYTGEMELFINQSDTAAATYMPEETHDSFLGQIEISPEEARGQATSEVEGSMHGENITRQGEETVMKQHIFYVIIANTAFEATFADNTGARALKDLLTQESVTIAMRDYGGFEKVGSLGQCLSRDDRQITTQPGDIVLYQGNQIVLFYGSNSWSYTCLGKINDLTGLAEALGNGDISITLSLQIP